MLQTMNSWTNNHYLQMQWYKYTVFYYLVELIEVDESDIFYGTHGFKLIREWNFLWIKIISINLHVEFLAKFFRKRIRLLMCLYMWQALWEGEVKSTERWRWDWLKKKKGYTMSSYSLTRFLSINQWWVISWDSENEC